MIGENSEIDTLAGMRLGELRDAWRERFGKPAPAYQSRALLLHAFAYQLQARRHGNLDGKLRRRLNVLAREFEADPRYVPADPETLQPGTVLVRDWNGRRYGVTVTADGFLFDGVTYSSLTQVARVITGVPRSGPLFFKVGAYRLPASTS